jgi:hypothetical protein
VQLSLSSLIVSFTLRKFLQFLIECGLVLVTADLASDVTEPIYLASVNFAFAMVVAL